MICGGIDIGSRYIKYTLLDGGSPILYERRETGHNPLAVCRELMESKKPDRLVATGYGRYLLEVHGEVRTVTEIKAVARGVREVLPTCRTIIDIGGQDTKVVVLNEEGQVTDFEMNDRCAAGTGRFLEIMAKALSFDMDEFGSQCGSGDDGIKINSMCTVFAESEVIGLITKGMERGSIAAALHRSVAIRVVGLLQRVGVKDDVVFAGGCARNLCLRHVFEERLRTRVHVPGHPDMLAALGAARIAMNGA